MIPSEIIGVPLISYLYYYGYKHFHEFAAQNWQYLTAYAVRFLYCF